MTRGQGMSDTLTTVLDSIAAESPHFDKSFALVDQLLLAYGEDDLANRLISEIDETTDWRVVADLFGILQWSTSDNGYALMRATEQWLRDCNNERKVNIALHLDTFPFKDKGEMQTILELVANRFPSSREQCMRLLESRE